MGIVKTRVSKVVLGGCKSKPNVSHHHTTKHRVRLQNHSWSTEAQNQLSKYGCFSTSVVKSVYGIAIMLVQSFALDSHQHYLQSNLISSSAYWRFSHTAPVCLRNGPPRFVKHCAAAEYQATDESSVNFWKGGIHVEFSIKSNQNHLQWYPAITNPAIRKTQL